MKIIVLLLGCFVASNALAGSLIGSEWQPEGNDRAFIRFESGGRVVGNGGCNGFFSTMEINGGKLSFGQIGSTRKLCAPAIMKREQALFDAMAATTQFERKGTRLILVDGSKKQVLRLRQTDWD